MEPTMKSLTLVGLLGLVLTCVSCGGYGNNSSSSASSTSIAGNWQFTYTSAHGGSSTVSGPLTQTGSNVSGSVNITGSCSTTGTISGTLSGTNLTATLTEANPETISITGTVSTSYSSSSGTYQVTSATGACASAGGDTGTWSGTRTAPAAGMYVGTIRSADRLPVGIVVHLNDDEGQLSGLATFTNSTCLDSMSVAGTVSGLNVELQASVMNGSGCCTERHDG